MSCPPGSVGAGRRRTPAMAHRAALRPYLHELDTFVHQELRTGAYVRYADDWLLFSNDKEQLHE